MDRIEMNSKFDTNVDRAAADLANDYLGHAYRLLKSVHPECGGFTAEVAEVGDDGSIRTRIDLLIPQETKTGENDNDDYVIV